MRYLDVERLSVLDPKAFQSQHPFPWMNPAGLLTEEGYQRLRETLPDVTLFTSIFGKKRVYGQQSHDRFALEYHDALNVAEPWREFVAELRGKEYQQFLRRMMRARSFELLFHWHYTPRGCSVSPHCDSKRKLGSHIFYFNTCEDWDPAWGGETLLLDDGGRFSRKSAPGFEDFDHVTVGETLGNRSLLFARTEYSWHGVREIRCPKNAFRKVFIVVINRYMLLDRLRRIFGNTATGYD